MSDGADSASGSARQREQVLNELYGSEDISARILAALGAAGLSIDALTREDLSPFDEFHAGGLQATREMAAFAGLSSGAQVLDLGSGLGGPARTLADEYDCDVTGVDITDAFCRAATLLTRLVGLGDRVRFQQGDAEALPFDDAAFDVVWSQYMLVNVEHEARMFEEVLRVLRPGGRFVLETLFTGPTSGRGSGPGRHYPVFWAADAGSDWITDARDTRRDLECAGFVEEAFEDRTAAVCAMARARLAAADVRADPSALWLGVVVPDDALAKMRNSLRNNEEGRTVVARGRYVKPTRGSL